MSICQNCTTDCQSGTYRRNLINDDGTLAVGLAEIALARIPGDVVKHLTEGLTLIIRAIGIANEIEIHLLLLQHDSA